MSVSIFEKLPNLSAQFTQNINEGEFIGLQITKFTKDVEFQFYDKWRKKGMELKKKVVTKLLENVKDPVY